tara:strand:- start:851 stop:1498 length:648 start_codon:yes stop_codon:yes gene_type:complete
MRKLEGGRIAITELNDARGVVVKTHANSNRAKHEHNMHSLVYKEALKSGMQHYFAQPLSLNEQTKKTEQEFIKNFTSLNDFSRKKTFSTSDYTIITDKINEIVGFFERIGVEHLDLHANNILVFKDKNGDIQVKVIDFGESIMKQINAYNHNRAYNAYLNMVHLRNKSWRKKNVDTINLNTPKGMIRSRIKRKKPIAKESRPALKNITSKVQPRS